MQVQRLVGRDATLAALSEAIGGAADRGDAILLVGEPGIGKTACLVAAEAMARATGMRVLETSGSRSETHIPYAGLQRLLRPILGSLAGLPQFQQDALLAALGMHDTDQRDLFVVCIATLGLLRDMPERAILITADDLQWLDDETRHVLAFVARRLSRLAIVVIGTTPSGPLLVGVRDAFRELPLDRLDESAAHRVLAQCAPELDSAQCNRVVEHAQGNPLALIELAQVPASMDSAHLDPFSPAVTLTTKLERAFAGRLHELPGIERDAVLVAALAADANVQEVLAATALLSARDVTSAVLDGPQAIGLLHFDETRLRFSHPLVGAAIARQESLSRRQAAHRALGAVITTNAYRRAWHRALGTGTHDDAIAAELEATTLDSIRHGDTPAAIKALERAAHLSAEPRERGRRLLLAAQLAARVGQPDLVVRLLGAAEDCELSTFDGLRADLLREDSDGIVIANSSRVIDLCKAATAAAAGGEVDLALDLAYAASRRHFASPVDLRARSAVTSIARDLATTYDDPRAVAVLALSDPVGHGRAVLAGLESLDTKSVTDGEALSAYAAAASAVGHPALASELLSRAESDFRAKHLSGPLSRSLCSHADLHLELGDWVRATASLAEFDSLSTASMSTDHRAAALATGAKALALRGETSRALELVSTIENSPNMRSGSSCLSRAQIVRGVALISSGEHADAYVAFSRVFEAGHPSHHFVEQFSAVAYLAESAIHAGKVHHAREVVERMQTIATTSGSPALSAQLAYARAVLASDSDAEPLYLEGLAADSCTSPWQRARLQLAYGQWLRRQQRVTQSRVPLRAALDVFRQLGASRWTQQALDELMAAGAQPEEGPPSSGLLTTQEARIAHLAAQGFSNREIGKLLYLSPRTIGSHLYRVFPKLGISMRSQIASRLDEVGSMDRIG